MGGDSEVGSALGEGREGYRRLEREKGEYRVSFLDSSVYQVMSSINSPIRRRPPFHPKTHLAT
jgi:hypothetical protein